MFLQGLMTALVTPFDTEGSLDMETWVDLIGFQLDAGVDGLVILGTTGEASALTAEEQTRLITTAVSEIRGRVPLVVGCSASATAVAIDNIRRAASLGASAVMVATPPYNRPSAEGLLRHFLVLADASPLPICLYNIPKRTGINLPVNVLDQLFAHPQIIAIKEGSGDMTGQIQPMFAITIRYPHVSVLSSDDCWALPIMALGGHGVVSVLGNIVPTAMVQLVRAAEHGDYAFARSLHHELWPLMQATSVESNPTPIKAMLAAAGRPVGPCRLPLCELSLHNQHLVSAAWEHYKLTLSASIRSFSAIAHSGVAH